MTPERLAEIRACIEARKSIGPVFQAELLAEVDRLQADLDAFREWLPAGFVPIPRSAFGPLDGEG